MQKKTISIIKAVFIGCACSAFMIACNNATDSAEKEPEKKETKEMKMAEAVIAGTKEDTTVTGTLQFDQEGDGKVNMKLEIVVPKLANKTVAVHIHESGDCGDAGKNAGGHWNPTNKQHGKWGSGEFHSGDIGNISLDGDGKGTLAMDTDLWSIGGDIQKDILGKAIIVHSGTDDYTSQPAGNAGTRIGCGTIAKK